MKIALPCLLCIVVLGACTHKAPEPQAVAAKVDTTHTAAPWDDLKKDEQRAKDVQKTVDQQNEQQRKQLESAEQ